MGRHPKPISTPHLRRGLLAAALRALQAEAGLTFDSMATGPSVSVSSAALKRAASGEKVPKAKTVKDFAAACGADLLMTDHLLKLRTQARIEERGVLAKLRAPKVEMIADRADLGVALVQVYEAAGAPTPREIQDASGNPHALPLSTIRRCQRSLKADPRRVSEN